MIRQGTKIVLVYIICVRIMYTSTLFQIDLSRIVTKNGSEYEISPIILRLGMSVHIHVHPGLGT